MIKTIPFGAHNIGSDFIAKLLSDAGIAALWIIPGWLLTVKQVEQNSQN